ncbi:FtsW/RodA/SpoVE family cell cycle protein [bacterium]|nr:FtsW/RodA/SpoVE family cell cycle protein [bacterium]
MDMPRAKTETKDRISGLERYIIWVVGLLLGVGFIMTMGLSYHSSTEMMGETYYLSILKFVLTAIVGIWLACLVRRASSFQLFITGHALMIVSLILLYCTLKYGDPIHGARRWIEIFGFRFQPVEIFKFALAIGLASILVRDRNFKIKRLYSIFLACIFLLAMLASFVFIYLQPNHSANIICVIVAIIVALLSRKNWKYVIGLAMIAVIVVGIFIMLDPEKSARVKAFASKWAQSDDKSLIEERYQVNKAMSAIARGGWLGNGIGRSIMKYSLPAVSTDFVFAIIVEEFGFVGGTFLLLCYLFLIMCALSVVSKERDEFLRLAGVGVVLFFTLNVFLHVAVNLDLAPTTGIPLPFVSQGGSALLVNLVSIGLILNLARRDALKDR